MLRTITYRTVPAVSRSAAANNISRKYAKQLTHAPDIIQREDNVGDDEKGGGVEDPKPEPVDDTKEKPKPKPKPKTNPCTRTILAEGTCKDLALGSKWLCCDPENGFKRPGRKTSPAEEGKTCESEKWTPIFTCDNKCDKALEKGCDDNDNWMAIPGDSFDRSQCGDVFTICANGKQTTGYVRDRSETATRFEVSPGIQKALGVTVGSSFLGSVYRPGAKQAAIDKDACCNTP
jgi:hypothetical protein